MKELSLGESIFQACFLFSALGSYSALSVWVIDRDMRRLPPARLERAYSTTSFAAAVFCGHLLGLPQLAVLVHFIRTRRSIVGVLLGIFWSVLTFVPAVALATVIDIFVPD